MDSKFGLENIDQAAAQLLQAAGDKKVIAFYGEMGAGKTTFIAALCKLLGVQSSVSSPTFSIINQYGTSKGSMLYHLDLYRLKNSEEAQQAGVEDCYYSGNICLVEWPEIAADLLPQETVHCYLSLAGQNQRKLQIKL